MRGILILSLLLLPLQAQEPDIKPLQQTLAAGKDTFNRIELKNDGSRTDIEVELGSEPVKFDGEEFDGFRFTCPADVAGRDYVWYFNAPSSWANWYILPVEEEPGQAFRDWLDGDKMYQPFDKAGEKERHRILQTLKGSYFKPGAEYLMWFRNHGKGPRQMLRGTIAFSKPDGDWDHDAMEKALSLSPAPLEQQVEALNSRGGMILLDERFFEKDYAKSRIESGFSSIRSTKRMSGGFFLTMQTFIPPCATQPPLNEIVRRHGAADFIRSSEEQKALRKHAGGDDEKEDEDEADIVRHHYDYFALEVESGAENPKVVRVGTYGVDFSVLRPPASGSSYAGIDIENLIVFHRDGKEVGRAYYFLEGDKKPLFIKTPPAGEYRAGGSSLISEGDGKWQWVRHFPGGKVARKMVLEGNRFHGKSEGFHKNGKTSFTAVYKDGELNGEVIEFDEDGKEVSKRIFKDGKPVGK